MINGDMNYDTLYRIPSLTDMVTKEHKELRTYYDSDVNKKNWDSYGADPIKRGTVDAARAVLNKIHVFFLENIGLLNNRSFEIDSSPLNSGEISIKIDYAGELVCYFTIKTKDEVHCHSRLKHFYVFKDQTIVERNNKMFFPEGVVKRDTDINGIKGFLNVTFYEHKWSTYEN